MDSSLNNADKAQPIEINDPEISRDTENRKVVNGYLFLKTVGRGSYSKVKVAEKEGRKYAVKILNKRLLSKKTKGYGKDTQGNLRIITMIEDAENEIGIYKKIPQNCERIVKLYEIINDMQTEKTYLIMEYCELGPVMRLNERSAKFFINPNFSGGEFSENQLKVFIRNIAEGLNYLHMNNIIHRDIKIDNILLDSNRECKITDFGTAIIIDQEDIFTKTEGNLFFYPPEFCDGESNKTFAGKSVDIWAFGVTIYLLAFTRLPFMPSNPSNIIELFDLIRKCEIVFPKREKSLSEEFKQFIKQILEKDPSKRLTASEILNHPYLNS